jgi:5-methylthioadenosine/S-adenosylhomocysteine deaminase
VLPGFANTHTHLSRVLARGIYEDLSPPHTPPFTGGLAPLPLPALSADEERVMVRLGALEAIRSGTTLVLEESAGLDSYAGALLDTGLRLVLCERAWDRANASIGQPGEFRLDPALAETGLARIAEFYSRWHGSAGRLTAGLAAWAPDLCSPSSWAACESSRPTSARSRRCTSTRSGARSRRSRRSGASGPRNISRAPGCSPIGWWPRTVAA